MTSQNIMGFDWVYNTRHGLSLLEWASNPIAEQLDTPMTAQMGSSTWQVGIAVHGILKAFPLNGIR